MLGFFNVASSQVSEAIDSINKHVNYNVLGESFPGSEIGRESTAEKYYAKGKKDINKVAREPGKTPDFLFVQALTCISYEFLSRN